MAEPVGSIKYFMVAEEARIVFSKSNFWLNIPPVMRCDILQDVLVQAVKEYNLAVDDLHKYLSQAPDQKAAQNLLHILGHQKKLEIDVAS